MLQILHVNAAGFARLLGWLQTSCICVASGICPCFKEFLSNLRSTPCGLAARDFWRTPIAKLAWKKLDAAPGLHASPQSKSPMQSPRQHLDMFWIGTRAVRSPKPIGAQLLPGWKVQSRSQAMEETSSMRFQGCFVVAFATALISRWINSLTSFEAAATTLAEMWGWRMRSAGACPMLNMLVVYPRGIQHDSFCLLF